MAKTIKLTYDKVKKLFPVQVKKAWENYRLNVQCAKEDGEEPGISPPHKCAWYLAPDEHYGDKLPSHPGMALHFFDSKDVAWVTSAGSDLVWVGDDWEQ